MERIPLSELENAKEVFITSSSHLVCPVIKIDNKFVGNGVIGDLTARLKKRFLEKFFVVRIISHLENENFDSRHHYETFFDDIFVCFLL